MSLNIRYLTNEARTVKVFTVTNSGVTPTSFEIFNSRGEIDKSIQHYAPPVATPVNPDNAQMLGVLDILYPEHPRCCLPKFSTKACLGPACRLTMSGECYNPDKWKGSI
jgi:hypothetical protein